MSIPNSNQNCTFSHFGGDSTQFAYHALQVIRKLHDQLVETSTRRYLTDQEQDMAGELFDLLVVGGESEATKELEEGIE